jgi:DNA-binding response OmpR family regulator
MVNPSDPRRHILLVVEDDEPTRDAIGLALAQYGCQVVLAAMGEDALSLIEQGGPFTGLYTDVELPGRVDGWQVGQTFHQKWPTRPIVYASGRDWRGARLTKGALFLRKPFRPSMLIAALTPVSGLGNKHPPD